MRRPRARAHIWVLTAYLVLALFMTYPLVLHVGSALPDIGEDGWKTYWNYWWVGRALLVLQTWPLFTPLLYAPTGTPLNFDQLALANDLIVLPVQLLLGVYPAYNLAILLWFTLSGYAGYLLNRYLLGLVLPRAGQWLPAAGTAPRQTGGPPRADRAATRADLAAFTGGLIFAFAPTQFNRLVGGGQMLMSVQWLALFVLFTLRANRARGFDTKSLCLAGLCFGLSALTDWYQPLWLAFWLALFVPYQLWVERRGGLRTMAMVIARTACSLAFGLLLISPLLAGMISSLLTWSSAGFAAPYDQYVGSSADLLGFVLPPVSHPVFGPVLQPVEAGFGEAFAEQIVFIGWSTLALCALGIRTFGRATRFWLAGALLFGIYIAGPVLQIGGRQVFSPLPFEAFYRLVPVIAQFTRSVSRGDSMVMLCLGVIAAFGMYRIAHRWWAPLLPLAIAFEYLWIPLPSTALAIPAFYQSLATEPGDFAIMHVPMEFNRREDMFFQTVFAKPMTTGFTSRLEPSTMLMRVPVLQHFRERGYDVLTQNLHTVAATVLRDLGVRYIIVDYAQMPPPSDELYYWQDHGAEVVGDGAPVYQDARMSVYAAPQVTRAVPYLRLETGWGILDPENWGTLQAEGWRPFASPAGLTVVAPSAQRLQLRFKSKSARGGMLRLQAGQQELGSFALTAQAQTFTSAPFEVSTGDNRIDIFFDGLPFGARLAGIDLSGY